MSQVTMQTRAARWRESVSEQTNLQSNLKRGDRSQNHRLQKGLSA
ncbi:MAG: hypothetical protein ACKVOA_09795 [Methylophilaceae bacterium]